MVTVDDSKLSDLSSRYRKPVLRVTEKSARSTSLLILLSLLPAMIAFPFRTIEEENASFGLQCLDAFRVTDSDGSPGLENVDAAWNSPLAVWLTSALTGKIRFLHFEGTILISTMATAIFLIVTFHLVKLLAGHRVAFWSLVFLVTHPLVVRMAIRPSPLAIGLVCSVTSLFLLLRHLGRSRKLLSYNVLFGGLAFGGVLLSSGLLSILNLLLIVSMSLLVNRPSEDERPSMAVSLSRMRTVGVFVLTAFAVAGWWILKSVFDQGLTFWGDWMFGASGIGTQAGFPLKSHHETTSFISILAAFFVLSGVIAGPFLVGLVYLFRQNFLKNRKTNLRKTEVVFFLIWFGLAAASWILSQTVPTDRNWVFSMSSIALAIPLTIFAGFCIKELTDCNLGLGWAVAVWEIGLLTAITFPFGNPSLTGSEVERFFFWSPVIAVAIVLISYCVVWFCRHRFRLAKLLTVSAIVSLPIYQLSRSWELIQAPGEESRTLSDFRIALTKLTEIETIVVSSPDAVPLSLKYSLRSRWPDARWITENHTENRTENRTGNRTENRTGNRTGNRIGIGESENRTLLVRWNPIDTKDAMGLRSLDGFRPVTDPVLYRQRELRAYFSGEIDEK